MSEPNGAPPPRNDELRPRPGTLLLQDLSLLTVSPDARPPRAILPKRLADLILAAPILRQAGIATLEPDGDASTLTLLRGSASIADVRLAADEANAAVARLAVVAGLDPLVEVASPEGSRNMARVHVRVGTTAAEVMVCVGARAQGLRAEVHLLSVDGRAPDLRAPGVLQRCTRCGAFQPAAQPTCAACGGALAAVEDAAKPGGTIGAYRVLARLGEGGGGTVFAGEHALLGRPVAIKVLNRNLAANPALAARFLSEARAASQLRHPSVVEVTDFGVLREGFPYMVMEHLEGETLEDRLARGGAIEAKAALRIAREVALALGAAHASGVAHNDVKPSNVMLLSGSTDEAPRLKLIDFGAVGLIGGAEELLFGTPGYMSPERVLGEPSDGRADLYALGVTLHEMLSGAHPFPAMTQRGLLLAQLRQQLPPPKSPFGPLPQAVERLLARAVAKRADARQQSAAELVADIDRALPSLERRGSRWWLP